MSVLQRGLDRFARQLLFPDGKASTNFSSPLGEQALTPPDSVSWKIFKNPLSLFVGGVAAVILEFAEPRVRAGVWQHSNFRTNPLARLQRTGLAAMMTVYGPRRAALAMIEHVTQLHERVEGVSPEGFSYRATDPELLGFVHATAVFGFSEAYSRYVQPLSKSDRDRLCAEAIPSAHAYGVIDPPTDFANLLESLNRLDDRLSPSPILDDFFSIITKVPLLPSPLKPLQRMLVRAAIEMVPPLYRERTELGAERGLRSWELPIVQWVGGIADELPLLSLPPAQSCLRLGLDPNYLYRQRDKVHAAA